MLTFKTRATEYAHHKYPDLVPVFSSGWDGANRKVLILIESPDRVDFKCNKLMTPQVGSGKDLKVNKTYQAIELSVTRAQKVFPDSSYCVALFSVTNYTDLIAETGATHVVMAGLHITESIVKGDAYAMFKQGNAYEIDNIFYTPLLPLDQIVSGKADSEYEDDGGASDLLFMWSRHFLNAVRGKNPYSIAHIVPKCKVAVTLEQVKKVLALMDNNQEFALDIETANLSSYSNKLYTHQIAVTEDVAYLIPVEHPMSPFTLEEQAWIKKRLKRFYSRRDDLRMMIVFNGKFDMRILRATLGVRVIYHPVWEITAGEHLLDENLGIMTKKSWRAGPRSIKMRYGNLKNLTLLYGNDYYVNEDLNGGFGKDQRNTIGHLDIVANVPAQRYCAADAQFLIGIKKAQIAQAKARRVLVKGERISYLPYYLAHIEHVMGPTVKLLSTMEEYGTSMDVDYIKNLMDTKVSPLVKTMKDIKAEFLALPAVKEAAAKLSQTTGVKAGGLFGSKFTVSAFEIKPAHLRILFFDILKMKPLTVTDSGLPSVDKFFYAEYKDTVQECFLMAEYGEASKLLSTYVGSWYESMCKNMDGALDWHLRPSFDFFTVLTGRLSSFDPNLQNVPSRGKLAKLVKRATVARRGRILPRWDFSAHEVRMWGNVSGDKAVTSAFETGYKLRQKLIETPTDEVRALLKKGGDVHIQNVFRFFNKWVEKSDPLRDAVKSVVFGVIYGKSAVTLGRDMQKQAIADIISKIRAGVPGLENELAAAQDPEPFVERAKLVLTRMAKDWPKGMAWLDRMKNEVGENFVVMSPIGRQRHLYRAALGSRKLVGDAGRRAKNSPIQGISSELGCISAYESYVSATEFLDKHDLGDTKSASVVHDAQYNDASYEAGLALSQIGVYQSTTGVSKYCEEHLNFKMVSNPEVELELGVRNDKTYKWDWTIPAMFDIAKKSFQDHKDLGLCDNVDDAMTQFFYPWKNKVLREELFEIAPLLDLGLTNSINSQIKSSLKTHNIGTWR